MSDTAVPSNALSSAPPNSGEKTSLLEKFSFFLLSTGVMPGGALINGGLLLFYTDVIGLDPAKIGILFLVARVFDGFNDPIQAYIIDHLPKTKMGRFRPYLIMGSFISTLNFLLVFFGPYWASSMKMVVVWITYLMIDMTSCFVSIPFDCMLPVMTDDPKDRNWLSMIRGVAATFGSVIVGMPLPLLLDAMPDNKLKAFSFVIIGAAVVMVSFISLGALGVKERIPAEEEQKYNAREMLSILTQRPVYALFLSYLLINIASATSGLSGLYFFTYVIKDLTLMPILGFVAILGGSPGIFIGPPLATRIGKRASFTAGTFMMFVACGIRLINIYSKPLMFISAILNTQGSTISHPLAFGIIADNMDYIEYKMDKRAEGAVSALNSLVGKASGGIGGALAGYVLDKTGYVPNAEIQTQKALNGITLLAVVLPTLGNLAASIIFRALYPITKEKMKEITEELRERRAARGELSVTADEITAQ